MSERSERIMNTGGGMTASKGSAPGATANRTVDVIVAGSGHNGLVTAAYLAKAGLDVLVLEASPTIGGMTSTNPMAPEAPDHLINEASIQASLFRTTTIDRDLGLGAKYGMKMRVIDPAHLQIQYDHTSLGLWRDPRRTADELRKFSPKDAESLIDLYRVIDAAIEIGLPFLQTNPTRPAMQAVLKATKGALKNRKELAAVGRWARASQAEAIEESFEHDIIRAPLLIQLPFMSFNADMGGWALIYLGVLTKYGVAMFEGGTGSLPKALSACLAEHGGRIRTSAEVEKLVVRGGRVVGVRLRGGEEIYARRGVCTAFSPKKVLRDLLPAGTLSHSLQNRANHIPTRSRGFADYKLNIALRGRLRMDKVEKLRGNDLDARLSANSYHTYSEALAAQRACIRGEVPDTVPGLAQITTAFDPSMAPPGCDTFWFWSGLIPNDPHVGWDKARDQITQTVISQTEHYYEGLEELEIARRPLALPEIEERFHALDGTVYHTDPLISRMGPTKPAPGFAGYSTPVPGLFLTGSGCHPVAGISGMPGQNAAKAMLKVFAREDRKGKGSHALEEAKFWDGEQAAVAAPAPAPDLGGRQL